MKNQKNLDQLYKERLQKSEVPPPADAWANIAEKLPKKQKKKVLLPVWYRVAGIAASLLLAMILLDKIDKNPASVSPGIVNQENVQYKPNLNNNLEFFHEQMHRSSLLLQELVEQSKQMSSSEKISSTRESENQLLETSAIPTFEPAVTSEAASRKIQISSGPEIPKPSENDILEAIATSEENLAREVESPEEKSEVTEKGSNSRLSISTKIAPIFGEKNGSGNSTSPGEGSLSYGFSLAYQLSEKMSIRSGLNRVDFISNSSEVTYAASVPQSSGKMAETMILASPAIGHLEQNLDFVEVPLEIEYTLLDKKLQLNLIGGGSLMFLRENELSLKSPGFVRTRQEPQEPEGLSYTGNIGLGLGYQVFRQFELNLEPMLKVNLKPSEGNAGLSPYYFGIYSGLSYRF